MPLLMLKPAAKFRPRGRWKANKKTDKFLPLVSKYRSVRICARFNPCFPGFQSGGKAVTLQCSLDETEVHGWNIRKGHELWLLWGLEKEKPFNFLDNLKPFTCKNYLDKGIWLHLFSKGIIVWKEMKPYIYVILCHGPQEMETTAHSLYCLLFIPHCLLVENQLCQLEGCPALPCQSQPASQFWEAKCHKS